MWSRATDECRKTWQAVEYYLKETAESKKADLKERLEFFWAYVGVAKPRNKFKIIMTFYQLSTKVSSVYEVVLPPDVHAFLESCSSFFSFGIDSPSISSTPLACMGLGGYTWKLAFYMAVPPALVGRECCNQC